MKKPLSHERLRALVHYDPETGVFTRLACECKAVPLGPIHGRPNSDGYLQVCIGGHRSKTHRFAWFYMTGSWPAHLVDHINTIKTDNRWANLRAADRVLNGQNQRRPHSNNKSGFLGVHPYGKRWRSDIKLKGLKKHLGYFDTAEQAHAAYVAAKRAHHEGGTL